MMQPLQSPCIISAVACVSLHTLLIQLELYKFARVLQLQYRDDELEPSLERRSRLRVGLSWRAGSDQEGQGWLAQALPVLHKSKVSTTLLACLALAWTGFNVFATPAITA